MEQDSMLKLGASGFSVRLADFSSNRKILGWSRSG